MTTHHIGPFTLEHDREWRAWVTLSHGTLQRGDAVYVRGTWYGTNESAVGEPMLLGSLYRRPVPLPLLDPDLTDTLWVHGWSATEDSVERVYVHPTTGEETHSHDTARDWLRALLPGYEEQLAETTKELPPQYAGPQTGKPRPGVIACPACECRYHDTTDVSHCDCGYPLDQMHTEFAHSRKQPSPVPADGWRTIETANQVLLSVEASKALHQLVECAFAERDSARLQAAGAFPEAIKAAANRAWTEIKNGRPADKDDLFHIVSYVHITGNPK